MRFLTGKRIIFGVTGLLIVLALAGWFLFGPNLFKRQPIGNAPPGSTIDAGCSAVYNKIMGEGWGGHRIMAEPGFKVEKALYLSGKEVKANYEPNANIQDDSHICYVLVRGKIDVGSPFTNTVATYSTGNAIYDPDSLMLMGMGSGEKY